MRSTLPLLLVALLLTACGGGGGGDPAYDLNGWWLFAIPDPAGGARPLVAFPGPATHDGAEFVHLGYHYAVSGTTLTCAEPDFESPTRDEYHYTIVSADRMNGEIHRYVAGAFTASTLTVLLRTQPPQGTFTLDGNPGGAPLSRASTTSFATVDREPVAGGGVDLTVEVFDMWPDGRNEVFFHFWLPDLWFSPREMDVPADLSAGVVRGLHPYFASAGTLTLSRVTEDRVEGEYDLVLGLDGTAHGAFSVPVLDVGDD